MFCALTVLGLCAIIYVTWSRYRSKKRVEGIHKKCVFITGCDSGFGNALARRLDVLGVPVFAGCLTERGASELKEKSSERLQTVIVNITSHDNITQAYEFVKDNLPDGTDLWGVVNNAGVSGEPGPVEYLTRKMFTDVYDVMVFGLIDVTLTFLPLLKRSEGRVVIMSSMAALATFPGFHPYITAKHAVRAFSGMLRIEKQIYGIKVACVLPGVFYTPMVDMFTARADKQWSELPQAVRDEFGEDYHKSVVEGTGKAFSGGTPDVEPVLAAYEHALFADKPRDEYFPGKDATFMSYFTMLPPSVVNNLFRTILRMGSGIPVPKYVLDKKNRKLKVQ